MNLLHHRPEPTDTAIPPVVAPRSAPDQLGAPSADAPVLVAEHLCKEFPMHRGMPFGPRRALRAVEDVSLALRPGRVTAIVGESGSGKTTVARLLAGVYPPTSGTVRFRGQPVGRRGGIGPRTYRRQVQLVFQDPFASLNPVHTVRYHLSRPLRIYGHVRNTAEEAESIRSLLARVSLTPPEQFLDKYPHELSGGQRQRVAIARAIAAQPSVLLADEPVSMLDVSIRLEVLNLLMRLKEEDRIAVLYITHDIASARYFADETLVMYAGQMVEGGASEEVIQAPRHPYTQLLLAAAPDPARIADRRKPLPARSGTTSGIDSPGGCRFSSRCPHAMAECSTRLPALSSFGGAHWTHCFLYEPEQQRIDSIASLLPASEVAHDRDA